ncbi:MAG TPA: PAS domain-containing protein [Kofleriaceae bacterium]
MLAAPEGDRERAERALAAASSSHEHAVRFYEDDSRLTEAVTAFLGDGLRAGDLVAAIATPAHREAFQRRLEAEGFDVEQLVTTGRLYFVDAHDALSKFMRGGDPDPELFRTELGALIEQLSAQAKSRRLRAYGELVDVLWLSGQHSAALRLEELCNDLQDRHSFHLLCAYSMAGFYKEPAEVHQVCASHTGVRATDPGDGGTSLTNELAQYASGLAREIAHRSEVEIALRNALRELRHKEEQLRESEQQFRDFVENAAVGLHQIGPDGTILWANRAELELLGYTREEYIGRRISDIHADRGVINDILARLGRGEELHDYEARLRAKDGSIRHVLISSNIHTRDGRFINTRCFMRDITQRKQAEEALRAREAQLQTTIDALPLLVAYMNLDLRYELVSAGYQRWFGIAKADILGKHLKEVIGPAAFEIASPNLRRAMTGEIVSYEAAMPYPTGPRCIQATYIPQRDREGTVSGLVTVLIDVTERKNFERYRVAAAERAQRLLVITSALADAVTTTEVFAAVVDRVAAAVDASSAALWLLEDDGRTARLAHAIGYSQAILQAFAALPIDMQPSLPHLDSLRNAEPIWISSPEALVRQYPHLASLIQPDRSSQLTCLPLVSDGRTLGVLAVTIDQLREPAEEVHSFLTLVARYAGQAIERLRLHRDNVEARSHAEQLYRFAHSAALADNVEQVFECGLDAIAATLGTERAAVLMFDDAGVMRYRAWRGLSDHYRSVVEGRTPWPRDATAPQPILVDDVEADTSLVHHLLPLFRSERVGALAFVPLITRGRLLGKLMIYYGERHRFSKTEIELAATIGSHLASLASRFAALAALEQTVRYSELFTGVLAHDLRNPLGAITTAAHLVLMRQEGEGDRSAKPLSRIVASGQRMERMIDQLLDFTRARVGGGIEILVRDANLADLCSQAIGEIELVYPDRSIQRSFVGDQGGTWDPDRLLQIISNLVANACQHGRPGSAVTVRLDGRQPDAIVAEVHNLGTIPEALQPTLFDPFRGTRHRRDHSRGLGLGLFIVKELVRAHGGTVEVKSAEPEGTTFTIRMPRRAVAGPRAAVPLALSH